MKQPRKKKTYLSDTETGIRRLDELKRLNVLELTDEEHLKVFFDRFECKAMVLAYVDKSDQWQGFGRFYSRERGLKHMDALWRFFQKFVDAWDLKWPLVHQDGDEIIEETDLSK